MGWEASEGAKAEGGQALGSPGEAESLRKDMEAPGQRSPRGTVPLRLQGMRRVGPQSG